MFRLNRGRMIGLALTGFIIYFLFLSSANTDSDFRKRTEEGLSRRHGILQGDLSDEAYRAQTNQKLNDILAQREGQHPLGAADGGVVPPPRTAPRPDGHANAAADDDDVKVNVVNVEEQVDADVGVDADGKLTTGVAGRKTMQKPKEKERPKYPVDEKQDSFKSPDAQTGDADDGSGSGSGEQTKATKSKEDDGKDFAREKLQEYLKKPLVIFSKSYCPHSKRAKQLLLETYTIVPTPFVVELDQLTQRVREPSPEEEDNGVIPPPTLGKAIQDLLGEVTGRRTVPNIIVGGSTSIGGNDLIWDMHAQGTLGDKIRALGGKRIVSVELAGAEGKDAGRRRSRR